MGEDLKKAKERLFRYLRHAVNDPKVIQTMAQVTRERFIPLPYKHQAYQDMPLPIGEGQTISQPYIVAVMTSALELKETDKVLELGTGCGYQTAILAKLVPRGKVVTVERIVSLAHSAKDLLQSLGYSNVEVKIAGQVLGCSQEGPFDAIIVTAGAPKLNRMLLSQMANYGRMVIPVGSLKDQDLLKVVKTEHGSSVKVLESCRFVPLIGKSAWDENAGLE